MSHCALIISYTERELVERYAERVEALTPMWLLFRSEVMMSFIKARQKTVVMACPEAVLFGADGQLAARFTTWEETDKPGHREGC
ncbi:MAG: hypothetical protein WKF84_17515 [Pyrinomonadaceae bacterium]